MVKRFIKKWLAAGETEEAANGRGGRGWIGVDLDGTLATYDGWYGPAHIGEPVEPMLRRVREWLEEGVEVRVFTARASVPEYIPYVRDWLKAQGLPELKVTNIKDFGMICLWDDRCVEVLTNEGRPRFNEN